DAEIDDRPDTDLHCRGNVDERNKGRAQGVNTCRPAGEFDESSVLSVRLPLRVSGPNGKLEHWASNATTPAASAGRKTQDQLSRIHPYGYMAFSAKSHSQSGYLVLIPIGRWISARRPFQPSSCSAISSSVPAISTCTYSQRMGDHSATLSEARCDRGRRCKMRKRMTRRTPPFLSSPLRLALAPIHAQQASASRRMGRPDGEQASDRSSSYSSSPKIE
ncbi:hypothetical protein CTAM01_03500, partial [Colletotrichum tamarilloi]